MILYFIISFLAIIISVFFFLENIIISSASLVSIVLIAISILQAFIFYSQSKESNDPTNNTYYSTREIDHEATKLSMKYHTLIRLAIIPLLCIFIIYFGSVWKIILPICIYFLSFLAVYPLVKLGKSKTSNSKDINT